MVSDWVSRWFSKFKKYLFTYRDGFYELPYLANSPELIVESMSSMPFIKNDSRKNYFTTNTMFVKGDGHYQELEEGLWIIMSNIEVKKNLSFKLYYEPGIPADYHFLTLYINAGQKTVELPRINFDIDNIDRSWTFFKAGSEALNTHFKGQKSIFFTIYLSKDWVNRNLAVNGQLHHQFLQDFFDSDKDCIFLPNFLEEKKGLYQNLVNSILNKDENGVKDLLLLKSRTFEIISSFMTKLDQFDANSVQHSLPEKDKRKLIKVEYLLGKAIFDIFPSIQYLAKEVGVSETKLKSDFKSMYGSTIFQYYKKKQMLYAKEIMQTSNASVKEIAYTLNYNNQSKFAAAFKKIHGHLPSELNSICELK